MIILDRGLDVKQHQPTADSADDHKEHQQHHEHRERCQQVLTGRQVLVDDQPATGPHRDDRHQDAGNTGNRCIFRLIQAQDNGRADQKRHRGQQLVADTKERPNRADIARVDEITPSTGEYDRGDDNAGPPFFVSELRPDLTHHFL